MKCFLFVAFIENKKAEEYLDQYFIYLLWISGKVVPKKEVTEIIQRFNIQVNNLTQVSICLNQYQNIPF